MEVDAIDWEKPLPEGHGASSLSGVKCWEESELINAVSNRTTVPTSTELALTQTLASMRDRGVKFLYGRWLIEGGPKVLLFDTGSVWNRLDEWKTDLWNLAGIPSPPNDTETNETILFGYLVAWFLGEVRSRVDV
jgi:glycogen(starch) synthase